MKQRFLSVLLSLMPASVFAAEGEEQPGETVTLEEDFYTNDELLEMYFYSSSFDSSTYTDPPLTGNQKMLYDALKTKVQAVANGTVTSTEFTFDGLTFNLADIKAALGGLIMGCPQYFYWWGRSYTYIDNQKISLVVAKDYSKNEGAKEYEVNSEKITAANKAIKNAESIVEQYKGKSTYEKLDGYRKEICSRVTYNDDAVGKNTSELGSNPWEMVYVFDGDSTTNVVCEGYSRAFQYLCNLTTDLGAECYTVSGTMSGGTGAGGHMWNIVRIGSASYLVDVTNCDDGTAGAPRKLFMVGGGSETYPATGYSISVGNSTINYQYYASNDNGHTD